MKKIFLKQLNGERMGHVGKTVDAKSPGSKERFGDCCPASVRSTSFSY